MQKIDLHQDIILSFQENCAWFGDHSFSKNYAWGYSDYIASDVSIVFAAFWPYQVIGDLYDLQKRKIIYDKKLFDQQYDTMSCLIDQYGLFVNTFYERYR
jgi:hypothetical protein